VHELRFRLRTLMIGIALLALVLAALVFVLRTYWEINAALNAFYGPDGTLARERKFSEEAPAGDEALRLGDYVEAEARYRSALDLYATQLYHEFEISHILTSLADALVGQGRYSDAEPLYQRALELREKGIGSDPRSWRSAHLKIAETLDHYATLLRHSGRLVEAEAMKGRAEAIRAEWEQQKVVE
jgi:tetratricopeptide (TPR) repeat protein